jgi:DNA-binding NarL/FixJ family response regulator
MKNTKIIMFSNLSSQGDIDKAMSNWADWYLLKANYTPSELVSKVKDFLKLNEEEKNIIVCPHCWKDIDLKDIKIQN